MNQKGEYDIFKCNNIGDMRDYEQYDKSKEKKVKYKQFSYGKDTITFSLTFF